MLDKERPAFVESIMEWNYYRLYISLYLYRIA